MWVDVGPKVWIKKCPPPHGVRAWGVGWLINLHGLVPLYPRRTNLPTCCTPTCRHPKTQTMIIFRLNGDTTLSHAIAEIINATARVSASVRAPCHSNNQTDEICVHVSDAHIAREELLNAIINMKKNVSRLLCSSICQSKAARMNDVLFPFSHIDANNVCDVLTQFPTISINSSVKKDDPPLAKSNKATTAPNCKT